MRFLIRMILSAAMLAALTACASSNRPATVAESGVSRVTLTAAQSKLVQDGVKQMVENQSAQLSAISATSVPRQPGVHVCGYVKVNDAAGKEGPDLPFYVELREANGKPVTERGQVGSDASKTSKINFVCRRNG